MSKQVIEISVNKKTPIQVVNDSTTNTRFIFAEKGQRIKTYGSNAIKTHLVEENGDIVYEMETKYDTETVPVLVNNVEILSACIDSFDDNSVTLIISYPDHETKRLFRKKMRDKLDTMGLLEIGANFYLDTKENQNGFNIKIVPMSSNYDKVTNDLFDEYIKAQRECDA